MKNISCKIYVIVCERIYPSFLGTPLGAMIYVVVEELIPEMSVGKHSNIRTIFFSLGFTVMLTLDVVLGTSALPSE